MLEIGSLLDNKYRVLDVVGHGGMSTVYLARNEKANKSWAIKEVLKQGQEDLEIKKNSLIAETEMLKKLNHPNLPAIIDVIETNDTFLVVMDYIEGNDLSDILDEFGAQPQEKVIEWAKQVCDVLSYLHTRTPVIVYRDLKPANIMLKPDGNITLIDFGTAREAEVKDVANTVSLGTKGYAAPEQFGDGARADARTDIYCFGATIYHLVTGHSPAEEPYIIEPIRNINPSLSGGLEKIILKCTQPNPADRYQSCEELAYDLEHYQEIDDLYKKKQKRKLATFVATFIASLLCFVVAFFGYSENSKQIGIVYDNYIKEGKYVDAIKLNPQDENAFLKGIEFISSDGIVEDTEIQEYLEMFSSYEDSSNNGNIVYPLNELANGNINNYVEVCYQAGCSLWENYKTVNSRSSKAQSWFQLILPENYNELDIDEYKDGASYSISVAGQARNIVIGDDANISLREFKVALVCSKIQESKINIEKYSKSNTTSSLSGGDNLKEAYVSLWKNMNDILNIAKNMDDPQLSLMLLNEINTELNKIEYIRNVISYNSLENSAIINYVDSIQECVSKLNTTSDIMESNKNKLLNDLTASKDKLNTEFQQKK